MLPPPSMSPLILILFLACSLPAFALAGSLNLALVRQPGDLVHLITDGVPISLPADNSPLLGPRNRTVTFVVWSSAPTPTMRYQLQPPLFTIFSASGAVVPLSNSNSSLYLSLPPSGPLLGPTHSNGTAFTVKSQCFSKFIGLASWSFLVTDPSNGLVETASAQFLWRCAVPGCKPECETGGRGKCDYYEGVCVCTPPWMGTICGFFIDVPSTVCPGDPLPVSITMVDLPPNSEEWYTYNDPADTIEWAYLRTRTRNPAVPNSELANQTTYKQSWVSYTFLKPAIYSWFIYYNAQNFEVGPTFTVLPYDKCGLGQQNCSSDDQCGGASGAGTCVRQGLTAECECSKSRFWHDCSHGCDANTLTTENSGEINNDAAANSDSVRRYAIYSHCEWKVVPTRNGENSAWDAIDITPQFLSVDEGDSVTIFPIGTSVNESHAIVTWVGMKEPAAITLKQADGFRVVFSSDYSNSARGFRIAYATRKLPLPAGAIIGIAIPSVVVLFVIIAVVFAVARRERKMRKARLAAAANEPEADWADIDEAAAKGNDAAASIAALKGRGIIVTGTEMLFGLEEKQPCPVGTRVEQTVSIQNFGKKAIRFTFYVPREKHKYECTVRPGKGVVKAGSGITTAIGFTLSYTTNVNHRIRLAIESIGGEIIGDGFLDLTMEGAISDCLDPLEITLAANSLGSGAFGTVFPGEYRQRIIAVKVLKKQHDIDESMMAEFSKEIDLYRRLRCPFIVDFVGACHVPGFLCLCTELIECGNLDNLIKNAAIPFELQIRFASNIAEALAFLHANRVIYRDMKPSNVLVTSTSLRASVNCKIGDFGTAMNVENVHELFKYQTNGTPVYMAPELFAMTAYNCKVDMYAYGVTLWQMMSRTVPWTGVAMWHVPDRVMAGERPQIPATCPALYADLIGELWASNMNNRPEFADVLKKLADVKKAAAQADLDAAAGGSAMSLPKLDKHAQKELKKRMHKENGKRLKEAMKRPSENAIEMSVMTQSGTSTSDVGSFHFGTVTMVSGAMTTAHSTSKGTSSSSPLGGASATTTASSQAIDEMTCQPKHNKHQEREALTLQ